MAALRSDQYLQSTSLSPPTEQPRSPSSSAVSLGGTPQGFSPSREHLLSERMAHTALDQQVADIPAGASAGPSLGKPYWEDELELVSLTPKVITNEIAEANPDCDDLKFWPTILQWKIIACLLSLYLGTAVGIGLLIWRTMVIPDHAFHLSSENVHLISRYFPSILGTINVVLFRQLVREALRMEPYILMADQDRRKTFGAAAAVGVGGAWFPWQSLTTAPWSLLSVTSIVIQFIVSFVVSFKVALLASSTQVIDGKLYWVLSVRLWPASILVAMHLLMVAYTIFLGCRTIGKSTGLKWDPVSIADYASLFANCNALDCFAPLECRHNLRPKHVMAPARRFRLGYWTRVRRAPDRTEVTDIAYGIGRDTDPDVDNTRTPLGRPWHHVLTLQKSKPKPLAVEDCRRSDSCAHGVWPGCEHYPYNENPGCSRWIILIGSIVPIALLALSIYALVIGLPQRHDGFTLQNNIRLPPFPTISINQRNHTIPPLDPKDPNSNVLIWALIFRSAPTYAAALFTSTVITWIDLNMRFMQPFHNMFGRPEVQQQEAPTASSVQRIRNIFASIRNRTSLSSRFKLVQKTWEPATAANSVLLAYITVSPLQVPLTAWDKKHYKVCIYSSLNTISPLFPIFVGGLLTVTPSTDLKQVQFTFSLSAYIGIMMFLVLYSILVPAATPSSNRLLPRQLYSLADLMALCHQSRFMLSPHLNIADRAQTPTKAHMEARIMLSDDQFLFGKYHGRDGLQHIGFDVTKSRQKNWQPLSELPHPVRHISPKSMITVAYQSMTSTLESGAAALHNASEVWRANARNPFSQRGRGLHHNEHEMHLMRGSLVPNEPPRIPQAAANYVSGSEYRGDVHASRTRFARSQTFPSP